MIFVLALLHENIKSWLLENLWLGGAHFSINNMQDQSLRFQRLLSVDGIGSLFRVSFGQLFYFGCSSVLIGFFGLFFLARDSFFILKNIKKETAEIYKLFLLLAFLSILGISAIFMITPVRLDNLVYGRYIEITIGPILLYALLQIPSCDKKFISKLTGIFVICIGVMAVYYTQFAAGHPELNLYSIFNSPGICTFIFDLRPNFYIAAVTAAILGILIPLLYMYKGKITKYSYLLFVFIFFIVTAFSSFYFDHISLSGGADLRTMEQARILKAKNYSEINYVGYKSSTIAAFLQFELFDKSINYYTPEEWQNKDGDYYLVTEQISPEILKNYNLDAFIEGTFFLSKKSSHDENRTFKITGKEIPFFDKYSELADGGVKSMGDFSQLTREFPFIITPGDYKIKYNFELESSEEDLVGAIQILDTDSENVLLDSKIYKENFTDGKSSLEIDMPVKETIYGFYANIAVNKGTFLSLKSIEITAE